MPVLTKCHSESRRRPAVTGLAGAAAALLALLGVSGCDEQVLDHGLTYSTVKSSLLGGPPAPAPAAATVSGATVSEAAATPSPIRHMSGTNPDYPPLSSVPMRPNPPSTPAERQQAIKRLMADREASRLADEQLRQIAPPPLPVPPVPEAAMPHNKKGASGGAAAVKDASPPPAR